MGGVVKALRFCLVLLPFLGTCFLPGQSRAQAAKEPNSGFGQSKPKAANEAEKKQGWIVDKKTEAKGGVEYHRTACPENCKEIGDKAIFVTKEGRVWEIANQESLKGHE